MEICSWKILKNLERCEDFSRTNFDPAFSNLSKTLKNLETCDDFWWQKKRWISEFHPKPLFLKVQMTRKTFIERMQVKGSENLDWKKPLKECKKNGRGVSISKSLLKEYKKLFGERGSQNLPLKERKKILPRKPK